MKLVLKRKNVGPVVTHLVLISCAIIIIIPILWAISSSFKHLDEIFKFPIKWIPEDITFENYVKGLQAANFLRYFINSCVVSIVATGSVLLISSMAGYSFNRYNFPGKSIFMAIVIATLIIPLQVRVVPLYIIIRNFGWTNTYAGLIVPQMATPLGIFVMIQFMRYIPKDYFDAGRMDGISEVRMFSSIALPLSKSGISALLIITITANWNNYLWPLIVIDENLMRTLPLGLASFQGQYYTEYGQFFAVALVALLPMVVAFLIFQKHFIESIAQTGIKG